jgi:hypothetical protein
LMPRWEMSEEDLRDLFIFLKSIPWDWNLAQLSETESHLRFIILVLASEKTPSRCYYFSEERY